MKKERGKKKRGVESIATHLIASKHPPLY